MGGLEHMENAEHSIGGIDPIILKRNQERVLRCICMPPLVHSVMCSRSRTAAAAACWVVLVSYSSFAFWPSYIRALLLMNGLLTVRTREGLWKDLGEGALYDVFEDQVGEKELTAGVTKMLEVEYAIYHAQNGLEVAAGVMERVHSVVTFAEPPLSVIFFAMMLAASFLLSVTFYLIPPQTIIASAGVCAIFAGNVSYPMWISVEAEVAHAMKELREQKFGLLPMLKDTFHMKHSGGGLIGSKTADFSGSRLEPALKAMKCFLSRSPNELEMAHRYIAMRVATASKEDVKNAAVPRPSGSSLS